MQTGTGRLETVNTYKQACVRRTYWAQEVVRLGLAEGMGVYVRRVWLNPYKPSFEIRVGRHGEPNPR